LSDLIAKSTSLSRRGSMLIEATPNRSNSVFERIRDRKAA
jgi:hypothetical protein